MLQITPNNYGKLRELQLLNGKMLDAVTDKLCLKSLEKFGSRLDDCIVQDPALKEDENKEPEPTQEPEQEREPVAESQPVESAANVTKFGGKKRALFNETCNTLLDLTKQQDDPALAPGSPRSKSSRSSGSSLSQFRVNGKSARPPVVEESDAGSGGEVFKEPLKKVARNNVSDEVTRVEDSDDEQEEAEEEVVSGNIFARKAQQASNQTVFSSTQVSSSTMIQPQAKPKKTSTSPILRRSSGRLSTKSIIEETTTPRRSPRTTVATPTPSARPTRSQRKPKPSPKTVSSTDEDSEPTTNRRSRRKVLSEANPGSTTEDSDVEKTPRASESKPRKKAVDKAKAVVGDKRTGSDNDSERPRSTRSRRVLSRRT